MGKTISGKTIRTLIPPERGQWETLTTRVHQIDEQLTPRRVYAHNPCMKTDLALLIFMPYLSGGRRGWIWCKLFFLQKPEEMFKPLSSCLITKCMTKAQEFVMLIEQEMSKS